MSSGVDGPIRAGGDAFRSSTAAPDVTVVNNLPGFFPIEDWRVCYWAVDTDGGLTGWAVTLQLPEGYAAACEPVAVGQLGCVLRVRRWGVGCRPSVLEQAGFDPTFVAGSQASDRELLDVCFAVTHFDLPGGFVVADKDYPLLLFDPTGLLKGTSVTGISLLGALAFAASGGRVASDFQQVHRKSPRLYRQAVADLRELLAGSPGPPGDLAAHHSAKGGE